VNTPAPLVHPAGRLLLAALVALPAAGCLGVFGNEDSDPWVPPWQRPVASPNRWSSIAIDHAGERGATLDDHGSARAPHFLIGDGLGAGNGEILVSDAWTEQRPGGEIVVVLAGEAEHVEPTMNQQTQLIRLCIHLTDEFGIADEDIRLVRPMRRIDDGSLRNLVAGTRRREPRPADDEDAPGE